MAKEVVLKDPVENTGAQMVKEVASKTADIAGDGTTTATVLAQSLVTAGLKSVAAGANPIDLKRGMDKAVGCVVGEYAGTQKRHSNKLPLSIEFNTFVATTESSYTYVTQTGLLSIIALNVAPVLKGTDSDT